MTLPHNVAPVSSFASTLFRLSGADVVTALASSQERCGEPRFCHLNSAPAVVQDPSHKMICFIGKLRSWGMLVCRCACSSSCLALVSYLLLLHLLLEPEAEAEVLV